MLARLTIITVILYLRITDAIKTAKLTSGGSVYIAMLAQDDNALNYEAGKMFNRKRDIKLNTRLCYNLQNLNANGSRISHAPLTRLFLTAYQSILV